MRGRPDSLPPGLRDRPGRRIDRIAAARPAVTPCRSPVAGPRLALPLPALSGAAPPLPARPREPLPGGGAAVGPGLGRLVRGAAGGGAERSGAACQDRTAVGWRRSGVWGGITSNREKRGAEGRRVAVGCWAGYRQGIGP